MRLISELSTGPSDPITPGCAVWVESLAAATRSAGTGFALYWLFTGCEIPSHHVVGAGMRHSLVQLTEHGLWLVSYQSSTTVTSGKWWYVVTLYWL